MGTIRPIGITGIDPPIGGLPLRAWFLVAFAPARERAV